MKITSFVPPIPPAFSMTFTRDEGWALVMALRHAVNKYPGAFDREPWRVWAETLSEELRRDASAPGTGAS